MRGTHAHTHVHLSFTLPPSHVLHSKPHETSSVASAEEANKMGIQNLSLVFGPTIMKSPRGIAHDMSEHGKQILVRLFCVCSVCVFCVCSVCVCVCVCAFSLSLSCAFAHPAEPSHPPLASSFFWLHTLMPGSALATAAAAAAVVVVVVCTAAAAPCRCAKRCLSCRLRCGRPTQPSSAAQPRRGETRRADWQARRSSCRGWR